MRSLRSKITWSFLLLIGCSVLGTGIFVALLLRSSYLDSLTYRLEKEGIVLAETVQWTDYSKLRKQEELFQKTLDVHINFFDQSGNLIGERDLKTGLDKNGHNIPEVNSVLHHGKEREVQTSIRGEYLYAAVSVIRDNQVVGAILLSLDMEEINQSLRQVWISLILGLIIAYALAAFFSSRIASGITRPVEEITQVASDIARKKFHRRVRADTQDEIAFLGRAINRMAYSLQNQMETIRKSERRLNSIIESMESGLIMIDATGKVSLANRSFERMFGIPQSDLVGRSFRQLTYPYDISSLITECAESNTRIRKEIPLYYPEERILEANLAPMWVEKNGVGVVVVFHDLTAIRRLEQLRKDFVANVSHELKTPITSIRGFAETLLDGAMDDPETAREFLRIIHEESLRLQRLIGDLLDLTQIESKQTPLKISKVSVESLLQSVRRMVQDQIESKNQSLSVKIDHPFEVEVDEDRFRQILLNLLSNSINYTPQGGKIRLRATGGTDRWQLEISDTGIGIPEQDLPRIFERFYRVDKARARDSGGTGLGLAIVKHLVEEHQGQIEVKSKVGEGTTFILTFPLLSK